MTSCPPRNETPPPTAKSGWLDAILPGIEAKTSESLKANLKRIVAMLTRLALCAESVFESQTCYGIDYEHDYEHEHRHRHEHRFAEHE